MFKTSHFSARKSSDLLSTYQFISIPPTPCYTPWRMTTLNKKYQVKKSSAGLGLFATAEYKKGELVIEYTGERITEPEANRRGGKYLFELNDNFTIDGKGRANTARYLNHACKPNCYPELSEDEKQIFIYAKRKILIGEELTYNYGKMYFNELIKKDTCRCATCVEKRKSS